MEKGRLLKKTGIYFIGNLSSKILSVILVPLYAFYISADSLGNFDYSQTIMNMLVPIFFVSIWEAILKFLLSENKEKDNIVTTSAFFALLQAFLLCIIMYVYYTVVNQNEYKFYIIFMFVTHGFANVWQYYARGLEKNKLYVVSGIISTFVNFITSILLICVFKMQAEALYISYIIGNLSIILVIEFKLKILKSIKIKKLKPDSLKKMLLYSAPLVINTISVWLISGFGRIIITNVLGTEQNGLYAFGNKFSVIVTFLGSILNMAIIEEAIIIGKDKDIDNQFSAILQVIFEKFLSLLLLAIPLITIFYYLIEDTEYYASRNYFALLIFYALLMSMSTNVGSVFQAISKTKYISISTLIGSIFTVIISLALVNIVGIFAVIIAQLVGAAIMLISRYKVAQRFVKIKLNWKKIVLLSIIYFIVAIVCLNCNIIFNVLIEVVLFLILLYTNRNYIIKIISFFRNKVYIKSN